MLLNRFQVLEEVLEEETVKEKWQAVKESFTWTLKDVLGKKEKNKNKNKNKKTVLQRMDLSRDSQ